MAKEECPKLTPENAQQHFVVPVEAAVDLKLGDMVVFTEFITNARLKGGGKLSVATATAVSSCSHLVLFIAAVAYLQLRIHLYRRNSKLV